jgi:hypothetical protein
MLVRNQRIYTYFATKWRKGTDYQEDKEQHEEKVNRKRRERGKNKQTQ